MLIAIAFDFFALVLIALMAPMSITTRSERDAKDRYDHLLNEVTDRWNNH